MNSFQLILRNLLYRKTLSILTIFSVAIASSLLLLVSLVQSSMEDGAAKGYGPYELVIGAQGSDTQLVLNTFYHLGTPVGNIPYKVFHDVKKDSNVEAVYPITRGDSLKGFPIIGIDSGYFKTRYSNLTPSQGKWYSNTGEAVIGAHVAKMLGLKVGDEFHGSHGAVAEAHSNEEHAKFKYHVVGILPTLHTSDDKGVFTTLDYAWAVHGHDEEAGHNEKEDHNEYAEATHHDEEAGYDEKEDHNEHAEETHHDEDEKMITAMVVKPKGLMELQLLKNKYNNHEGIQAVYSSKVVASLLNMIDTGTDIFHFMSMICLVLATISLLLSLSATATERRRDIGLLRLLGKSRSYVMSTIVIEGILLTFVGVILGLVLGHLGAWFMQDLIFDSTGIDLMPWQWGMFESMVLFGSLLIGGLASLWPSLRMYRVQPIELFR